MGGAVIPTDLAGEARAIAEAMKTSGDAPPPDVRKRFIALRTALFQRGIYDPVLVRFDSFTAPKASVAEVAEELDKVAESLAR